MAALSGTALLASLEADAAAAAPALKADDLTYDLGLLAAFDAHAIDPAAYADAREAALGAAAAANAQLLVRAIFALPTEAVPGVGTVARLPARNTRLPRELPPPAPRAPTKWEAFAKTKGIVKKAHRDRMVFDAAADEGKGDFRARHGYKRARDAEGALVYELKKGDDPKTDHLERLSLEKKFKVTANQLNRVANAERATAAADKRAGRLQRLGDGGGDGAPRRKKGRAAEGGGGGGGGGGGDEDGVRRAPAGIPSIPISEGRADLLSGAGKQPRMRPSDSFATKDAQVRHAQVLTASMGRGGGGGATGAGGRPQARPRAPPPPSAPPSSTAPPRASRRGAPTRSSASACRTRRSGPSARATRTSSRPCSRARRPRRAASSTRPCRRRGSRAAASPASRRRRPR